MITSNTNNTLKVACLNVRGATQYDKFTDILLWIDTHNFDITILTETKINKHTLYFHTTDYRHKYNFYSTIDETHQRGSGVIIIANKHSAGKHVYRVTETEGRALTIWMKYKNKTTMVATGIYGAASHDKLIAEKIIKHIRQIPSNIPSIIAGDFNEDPSDQHKPIINLLLHRGETPTAYQEEQPVTWKGASGTMRHLDHIYTNEDFIQQINWTTSIYLDEIPNLDHKAVYASFYAPEFMEKTHRKKRSPKKISAAKLSTLSPEISKKYLTLDWAMINNKSWSTYTAMSEANYKKLTPGQSLMMSVHQKYEHIVKQTWDHTCKTMPMKLMDTNTLGRDTYHDIISSKIFKLEWNTRQIAKLAKENPRHPNIR